jgi:hypothetical protein
MVFVPLFVILQGINVFKNEVFYWLIFLIQGTTAKVVGFIIIVLGFLMLLIDAAFFLGLIYITNYLMTLR